MNMVFKSAATALLLGVLAFAFVTPSEARYGRWAAAGAGLAAGAAIGGAGYYRPGYAYRSGYDAYASGGSAYTTPGTYYQDRHERLRNAGQLRRVRRSQRLQPVGNVNDTKETDRSGPSLFVCTAWRRALAAS